MHDKNAQAKYISFITMHKKTVNWQREHMT